MTQDGCHRPWRCRHWLPHWAPVPNKGRLNGSALDHSGSLTALRSPPYAGDDMAKSRVDALLVERGLFETREKARAAVLAGFVFSGDRALSKPGLLVPATAEIRLTSRPRYVSRGGDKLEHALAAFNVGT